MNTIVLVAGAGDLVSLSEGTWVGVAVLLLLQGQEIVRGHAIEGLVSGRDFFLLDNRRDGDLLGLDEGRGRDGVVSRLQFVDALNEGGERDGGPLLTLANNFEDLGDVKVLGADLRLEVVPVTGELGHLLPGNIIWCKGLESIQELTRDRGAKLHVVAGNSIVRGRCREGHFGCGLQCLDANDSIALVR